MQYLQYNKVNYLSKSIPFIWTESQIYQDDYLNYVTYLSSLQYNTHAYTNFTNQSTGSSFTLWTINPNLNTHLIIYNIRPTFRCSNFTDIITPSYDGVTSSDTITFTITMNDISKTYTYPLQSHPINFFNITDYILFDSVLTSVSITATSTIPLTLLEPADFVNNGNGRTNMKILLY